MMVKVLLYGYCVGVASSRRLAQRLHEDIAFRVLAANNTPDFRTIADFRKDHLGALSGLFLQVLELCQQAGLVKLGHVALDGTKVRANASKNNAMSYRRMKEKEAQLQGEVDELLRRAQEVDEEEDRRYGRDKRGDELPEELSLREDRLREGRLRKIREAKAALEAQAQAEQAAVAGMYEEASHLALSSLKRAGLADYVAPTPPPTPLPPAAGCLPARDWSIWLRRKAPPWTACCAPARCPPAGSVCSWPGWTGWRSSTGWRRRWRALPGRRGSGGTGARPWMPP